MLSNFNFLNQFQRLNLCAAVRPATMYRYLGYDFFTLRTMEGHVQMHYSSINLYYHVLLVRMYCRRKAYTIGSWCLSSSRSFNYIISLMWESLILKNHCLYTINLLLTMLVKEVLETAKKLKFKTIERSKTPVLPYIQMIWSSPTRITKL